MLEKVELVVSLNSNELFNDLGEIKTIQNEKNLENILENCEISLEIKRDIIFDILQIQSNTSENNNNNNNNLFNLYLIHPYGYMNNSSIIDYNSFNLNSSTSTSYSTIGNNKKDTFFEIFSSSYKNNKRDLQINIQTRKKITIMTIDGLTETYEFIDFKSYWRFINTIRKSQENNSNENEIVSYRGKCIITNSEILTNSINNSTKLTTTNNNNNNNNVKVKDIEAFIQISNDIMEILVDKIEENLHRHVINLKTGIRAIGLTSDFTSPYPLELQFSSFSCSLQMDGHYLSNFQLEVNYDDGQYNTSTDEIEVSDETFYSLLIPNKFSTTLKILVKHDLSHDNIQFLGDNNNNNNGNSNNNNNNTPQSLVLGKLNLPIHAFIPLDSDISSLSPSSNLDNNNNNNNENKLLSLPSSSFPLEMNIEIPITPPDMDMIAKLSIYKIENLSLNSNNSPPNAYCVVYIVGRDGNVIESVGNKTIPQKSCNPIWNIEFMLHTHLGISEIESILIKVKDASIGTFRHKHIGQIVIPIESFLPTNPPATLKLPLEETERMKSSIKNNESFGEITVGTQLIKIPQVKNNNNNNSNSNSNSNSNNNSNKNNLSTSSNNIQSMNLNSIEQCTTPEAKNSSRRKSSKLALMSASVDENEHNHQIIKESAPQGGVAKIKCTLKHICPSTIWWPCYGLSSTENLTGNINQSSTINSDGSDWDDKQCLFTPQEFILRKNPSSQIYHNHNDLSNSKNGKSNSFERGSVRLSANNLRDSTSTIIQSNLDDIIRIPWSQIKNITKVTESSLSIIFLTKYTFYQDELNENKNSKNKVKRNSNNSNRGSFFSRQSIIEIPESQHGDISVEILVAPCPSSILFNLLNDRIQTSHIREDLIRLFNNSNVLLSDTMTRTQFRPALNFIHLSFSLLNNSLEILGKEAVISKEYEELSKIGESYLNEKYNNINKEKNSNPNKRPSLRTLSRTTFNIHTSSLIVRLRLYIALLIQKCRKVREKHFPSMNYLEFDKELCHEFKDECIGKESFNERKKEWLDKIQKWSLYNPESLNSNSNTNTFNIHSIDIITLIDSIISSCIQHIRIIILCGPPIDNNNITCDILSLLEETLTSHYTLISNVLSLFLKSEYNFQLLAGQINKTNFLKYLALHDHQFANMILPSISLVGYQYYKTPLFLGQIGLKDAVKLYSKDLVRETRTWLSKTITHTKASKQNSDNLPWDIEKILNGLIVSILPETLRYQMNEYTILLHNNNTNNNNNQLNLQQQQQQNYMTAINEDITGVFLTGYTKSNYTLEEINQMEDEIFQLIGLYEQILRSFCKSYNLLAQEYHLALQSRHWEMINIEHTNLTSPTATNTTNKNNGNNNNNNNNNFNELNDNLKSKVTSPKGKNQQNQQITEIDHLYFLVSVCNDCYRINTIHLPELLRIESTIDWSENTKQLINSVYKEYQNVSEYSIKCITRIIFRDLQEIILNFEVLWMNYDKDCRKIKNTTSLISPIQTIMTTIEDYLQDIKGHLESSIYFELISSCVEICSLRYLLFIKELSLQNIILDGENITHLQTDVILLVDEFKKHCEFELHHYLNPISRPLSTITDIISVISTQDTEDETFQTTIQRLCHQKKKYTNDEILVIQEAMNIILSLRLDCRGDIGSVEYEKRQQIIHNGILPLPINSPLLRIIPKTDKETILLKAFNDSNNLNNNNNNNNNNTMSGNNNHNNLHKILPSVLSNDKKFTQSFKSISNLSTTTFGKKSIRNINGLELQRHLGLIDRERSKSKDYDSNKNINTTNNNNGNNNNNNNNNNGNGMKIKIPNQNSGRYLLNDNFDEETEDDLNEINDIRIVVNNICAKNLVSKSVMGYANPYVVITYGEERKKLPVVWNSNNPIWENEELVFDKISINQINKKLDIKIYDKERIARKTLLGSVIIPIDGVDLHPIKSWFALSGGVIGSNSEIYVEISRKK